MAAISKKFNHNTAQSKKSTLYNAEISQSLGANKQY